MKTILFFCTAILFSCVAYAQSDARPDYPYATYNFEKMVPDCNDPRPWMVLITDENPSDAIPALPWPVVTQKGPNFPTATKHEEMMSPENIGPSIAYSHKKKMLPY